MVGVGDVSVDVQAATAAARATADSAMLAAKATARAEAVSSGIPAPAFDALDAMVRGGKVQDVLAGPALALARSTGAGALAQALGPSTGVTAGQIDGMIEGLVQGNVTGTVEQAAGIGGAAVGTAICGPPCGVVGGIVGTGAVRAVSDIAGWISGSAASERQAAYAAEQAAKKNAIQELFWYYFPKEETIRSAMQFAVAQIYNRILQLGVEYDPPNGRTDDQIAHDAMAAFSYDPSQYQGAHAGLTAEDVEVKAAHDAFVAAVREKMRVSYSGLWERNEQESGFTNVESLFLRSTMGHWEWTRPNEPTTFTLYPTGLQSFPFRPAGASERWAHCPTISGPPDEEGVSAPPDIVATWRCSLQNHLVLMGAIAQGYAKEWVYVATRDATLIRLKQQQAAEQARQQAAATAARAQSVAQQYAQQQTASSAAKAKAVSDEYQRQQATLAQSARFLGGLTTGQKQAVAIGAVGLGAAAVLFYLLE
jgi:hypothetical protein